MEPLFENRYTRDEAMLKEFFRRTQLFNPLYIFLYLYCIHSLAEFIGLWITVGYCSLGYLSLPTLILSVLWYLYHQNVKVTLKREAELTGGSPLQQHIVITENIFTVHGPNGFQDVSFDSIKKVRQSKNLILLCTNARLAWIFPKATFTKGTPEEFLAFLKAKGIK